jgi:hypothetical protein
MGIGLGDAVGSAPVREPDRVDGPGSGEPASRELVGPANIKWTEPPPPAEREWAPATHYAREAAAALRDAKAYSPEQAPLLKPWAIMATDSYYAFANETLEEAGREARTAEREWDNAPKDPQKRAAYQHAMSEYKKSHMDSVEADRLRGEARETPRSIAEDADDKERYVEAQIPGAADEATPRHDVAPRDPGPADEGTRTPSWADRATPEQYAKYVRDVKAAALDSVFKWENALSNAVLNGDPEEASRCRVGLRDAVITYEYRLTWSEKKPAE